MAFAVASCIKHKNCNPFINKMSKSMFLWCHLIIWDKTWGFLNTTNTHLTSSEMRFARQLTFWQFEKKNPWSDIQRFMVGLSTLISISVALIDRYSVQKSCSTSIGYDTLIGTICRIKWIIFLNCMKTKVLMPRHQKFKMQRSFLSLKNSNVSPEVVRIV